MQQRRLRRLLHRTLHPTLCGGVVPPSAERIASGLVRGKIDMLLCSGHGHTRQAGRHGLHNDRHTTCNESEQGDFGPHWPVPSGA